MSVVARVPSMRVAGASYDIERHGDRLACSCPRAQFLRKGERCKHVRLYLFALERVAHCGARHGGDRVCLQCLLSVLAAVARKQRRDRPTPARLVRKRRTL